MDLEVSGSCTCVDHVDQKVLASWLASAAQPALSGVDEITDRAGGDRVWKGMSTALARTSSRPRDGATRAAGLAAATPPSDQCLMRRIQAGDAAALAQLYRRYEHVVFAVARCVFSENGDANAEEVVLEIFWELWQRRTRYDSKRGNVLTYLRLLARSRSIDKLRSQASRQRVVSVQGDLNEQAQAVPGTRGNLRPEEVTMRKERHEQIRSAMERLHPGQREAIQMAFFRGMTHDQIAGELDLPLGTVKTRVRSGLIHLREGLQDLA